IDVDKDTGPEGLYEVTDVLPSGFRYLDHAYTFGFTDLDYFTSIADQTYQYRFSNGEWWQSYGDRNLVYYARASHVGTFEAEPALIQSQRDLSVFTTSQSGNITIQSLTP